MANDEKLSANATFPTTGSQMPLLNARVAPPILENHISRLLCRNTLMQSMPPSRMSLAQDGESGR